MMERKVEINVDNIIEKLLSVKNSKTPKQVNLLEGEIKGLCHKSKEIFMQQPIFLELEAPLKICGIHLTTQAIFTGSILTFSGSLTMGNTRPSRTTYF
jgi:hypothetical protein